MELERELIDTIKTRGVSLSFGSEIVAWYRRQQRELPWRQLFLTTGDPFVIWVSEIMLQQTTIQVVIPAYERFLQIFPDLRSLAAADEESVRLACRGLGYYRRFRMMHAAARELVSQASADAPIPWPLTFSAWRELPGIGDYTAAAIASIAFGVPKAVVDGNVERVFCRLFDLRVVVDPKLKKLFQKIGDRLIPADAPADFNQGLMELGQLICTKQQPNCAICPVQRFCLSYERGSQKLAPQSKKSAPPVAVRLHLLIIARGDQVALLPRAPQARFLRGTLGFPTAIEDGAGRLHWETEGDWPSELTEEIGRFQHSITKHRIEASVHKEAWTQLPPQSVWVPLPHLEAQLVSNLDRKALKIIQKHATRLTLKEGYLN